jgi:hypothetical protein
MDILNTEGEGWGTGPNFLLSDGPFDDEAMGSGFDGRADGALPGISAVETALDFARADAELMGLAGMVAAVGAVADGV